MLVTEYYKTRNDGVVLMRTYSHLGFLVENTATGARYAEVVYPENNGVTYVETNVYPEEEDISAEDALEILTGGE